MAVALISVDEGVVAESCTQRKVPVLAAFATEEDEYILRPLHVVSVARFDLRSFISFVFERCRQ